MNKSIIP